MLEILPWQDEWLDELNRSDGEITSDGLYLWSVITVTCCARHSALNGSFQTRLTSDKEQVVIWFFKKIGTNTQSMELIHGIVWQAVKHLKLKPLVYIVSEPFHFYSTATLPNVNFSFIQWSNTFFFNCRFCEKVNYVLLWNHMRMWPATLEVKVIPPTHSLPYYFLKMDMRPTDVLQKTGWMPAMITIDTVSKNMGWLSPQKFLIRSFWWPVIFRPSWAGQAH